MTDGWIKIHRKIFDNPIVTKDSDHLAVWIYLLVNASHKEHPTLYGGKKITLKPGQLVTGRKNISKTTGVSESKIFRILKAFKSDQQIEQQSNRYGSLISIVNWSKYQDAEQQNEQQVNNEWTTIEQQVNNNRTTSEQQVNTIQECKELKNDKNDKNDKNGKNVKNIHKPPEGERYGEFENVILTDDEYTKLVDKFPMDYQERIESLSEYLKQTGRRYKSHYATILTWARKEKKEQEGKAKPNERMDWLDELQRLHELREVDEVDMDETGFSW